MPENGNVGIGTLNPTNKLQVNGNARIDSSLVVQDSIIIQKSARIKDVLHVDSDVIVKGDIRVKNDLRVNGTARLWGDVVINNGILKLKNIADSTQIGNSILMINKNGKVLNGGSAPRVLYDFPVLPANIDCDAFPEFKMPIWQRDVGDVQKASPYFGYPHLAHPTNHYTNYTPFDAVFAWEEENTVHIQSGHAFWNENKDHGCSVGLMDVLGQDNPNHKRWEQYASPVRNEMKSFILGEADIYNTYIQNRRYGWNANASYTYKADIVSKNEIFAGDSVTQRTDFKEVTIEPNADVQFIACKAIHLKPGFHAKAGSKFHAKINTETCQYCAYSGLTPVNNRHSWETTQENEYGTATVDENTDPVRVYPNPGVEQVNLEILDKQVISFEYTVYDISGKLIDYGTVNGNLTQLALEKGVYIIRTKINDIWYVKKLIMQ